MGCPLPHLRHILVLLAVALVLACARSEQHAAAGERDDFGTVVEATDPPPTRIVSLSPTTTELLFGLGAGPRLVGRTSFDVWPDSALLVPDMGPGIQPNVEAVLAARPDLVVLYASADNRPAAERFQRAGIRAIAFRVDRLEDFRRATLLLGRATGFEEAARALVDSVTTTLERVRAATAPLRRPTVYWHIWDTPLITIGRGSYLHELVEIAGGRNIYHDLAAPSPQVSLEDVARRDPDVILAGPLGRERLLAEPRWQAVRAVRTGDLRVVDTNLVGRTSVRLGEAAVSLARLLHGDVVP